MKPKPDLRTCPRCGQRDFMLTHQCPPRFRVINAETFADDNGADWRTVFARYAAIAAQLAAEADDNDDGEGPTLAKQIYLVRDDFGNTVLFSIVAEPLVKYHSAPVINTDFTGPRL